MEPARRRPGYGVAVLLKIYVRCIDCQPFLELLPDGSYRSVLVKTSVKGARRAGLAEAARRGEDLDPALARHVRVVEYEVTDRDGDGELIALVTTITDWQAAPPWPGHTTPGGSTRPPTPRSKPPCAGRAGSCGPAARTWSGRRSGATS